MYNAEFVTGARCELWKAYCVPANVFLKNMGTVWGKIELDKMRYGNYMKVDFSLNYEYARLVQLPILLEDTQA